MCVVRVGGGGVGFMVIRVVVGLCVSSSSASSDAGLPLGISFSRSSFYV